ncbi:hypothetical protein JW851_00130 [Candidatus Woesearchaeota archaeon]|nr:hypothetical protein [Candidatus Woesearchaeota archaeon]
MARKKAGKQARHSDKHKSEKHMRNEKLSNKSVDREKQSKKKFPFVAPDFSKFVRAEKIVSSRGRPIANALNELKKAVFEITFSVCWLDCLIVFMLCLLIFKLISVAWYLSVIPALLYSVIHVRNRIKKAARFSYIEEKVPELKEKISTVADNLSRDNPVIQELNKDVLAGMHLIRTSYFFSFSRLTRELLTLAILAFLVTGVSAYDVQFINFNKVIDEVGDLRVFKGKYDINEELLAYEENLSEDIYGNKSVAILGNEELKLQINPVLSDVDISKIEDPRKRTFRSSLPKEISAQTDASFEDSIPKDYQTIVKNYFKDITKT